MAIEVEISGNYGIAKHRSNISTYSYTEESTPIAPGDSSGGVGTVSITALDDENSMILLRGDELLLSDDLRGNVSGKIVSISGSDGVATVSGVSLLSRLNIPHQIPPMETTVGDLLLYIFELAGILSGISIDPSIETIPIISPAYEGDLWVFVKDICTAKEFEISLVQDTITVRPLRQTTIDLTNVTSESWNIGDINLAQSVEVNYYNYVNETNFLAYPKGGWNSNVQVYQVDANQVLTVEIPVDAYLTSIENPTVQNTVAKEYGATSVYCVAGKDGLPITATQWNANGGSITTDLTDNGSTILVTITGANITNLSPFRIGVSSGPSDYYSSLRLRGVGISFDKQVYTQPTGMTEEDTSNAVGLTIDNTLISTEEEARDAAKRAVIKYSIPQQTFSTSMRTLNDGGQEFGNIAGGRVRYRDSMYRVRSATSTESVIDLTAEWDNLFSDFNAENSGVTFTNFGSTFFELTFTDFAMIPLRRE